MEQPCVLFADFRIACEGIKEKNGSDAFKFHLCYFTNVFYVNSGEILERMMDFHGQSLTQVSPREGTFLR